MNTANRSPLQIPGAPRPSHEDRHVMDYVRVVYKRRWLAGSIFLLTFSLGVVNALRETPQYEAHAQVLIEPDSRNVTRLDELFDNGSADDDYLQTQYRILQSRTLARRAIDSMKLWDAPRLGNGPEPRDVISVLGLIQDVGSWTVGLITSPFRSAEPEVSESAAKAARAAETTGETPEQSGRIDEFLGGVGIIPVRNSRIVEIRYRSTDPVFAAQAANGLAKAYIQQTLELRFSASKDATDFLSTQLAEQRKSVEASEAALQSFKERNGTVSAADSASNIVLARLTDLNAALTKAKTERINKEAAYTQLKSAEASGSLEAFPAVLSNEYIQKLKSELTDLQRQQTQLAERYGERHPDMIKTKNAIVSAEAKLKVELAKVVDSVRSEYQAAQAEERSLQGALDAQKGEALSMNRKGIEYSVLQREVDSNREVYQSLLQQTKETGISKENRTSNVRVVDEAIAPRGPVSPNVPRALTTSLFMSLALAVGIAFGVEQIDNRIRTPQEMKAVLGVPFLGIVPATPKGMPDPLIVGDAPPNFIEAFKTLRTNLLFSSAEEGLRSIVVTSAGPGEGKSIVAANLAIGLAQAGQRVLLIDADMRRPRVHELFEQQETPGLSNVLTGNAKTAESVRKTGITDLWLLPSGMIPPNPAELLGSRRWLEFIASLEEHFDWAIIDSPPVLAVADSSIAANRATGLVFVVNSDKTSRQAAHAAMEQLEAASAHIIGSVLNRVDIVKHPYYYASHYRKDYAKHYAKAD